MEPQNKQQNKEILKKTDEVRSAVDLVSDDANFVFLYKKAEKLAAAVFMVSNLMSENDPVRLSLREKVVELVNVLSRVRSELKFGEEGRRRAESCVVAVVSEIDIAFYAHMISEMNASVLRKEFMSLLERISGKTSYGQVAFPKDFFAVGATPQKEKINESTQFKTRQAQSIASSVSAEMSQNVSYNTSRYSAKNIPKNNALKDKKKKPEIKSEKRRESIISIIRDKGVVSIKDISFAIQGCSEKTIQRELIDLASNGVLKKDGEKRWTRYSLA